MSREKQNTHKKRNKQKTKENVRFVFMSAVNPQKAKYELNHIKTSIQNAKILYEKCKRVFSLLSEAEATHAKA